MLSIILWTAVIGLIISFFYKRKPPNYPPGPLSLPIVGTVQLLTGDTMKNLDKIAEKYGSIFSIEMGPISAVVLNNFEVIRQAFAEENFSGRATSDWIVARNEGKHGILFNDGPGLQEIRRFVLRSLKDLGFGKSTLEDSVKSEIAELATVFHKKGGAPTELKNKFNRSSVNALWRITTGERFDIDDPLSLMWMKEITDSLQNSQVSTFFSTATMRALWPPLKKQFDKDQDVIRDIKSNFRKVIKRHEDQDLQEDLVGLYLQAAKKSQPGSPFYGEEGMTNLLVVLIDLFVAGTETTATSLNWFFLFVAMYPAVQTKIQDEIDQVIGDRSPTMDDRSNLTYTEAVINESMRYTAITPLGGVHRIIEDCAFNGYNLPKDLIVLSNIHAALHDPTVWEKPDEFYPEHFLGEKGKKHEAFIPFSVGKRACIGESLSRMEIYLFVTCFLQEFSFRLPPGVEHKIELSSNLVRGPNPFQVIITPRKQAI